MHRKRDTYIVTTQSGKNHYVDLKLWKTFFKFNNNLTILFSNTPFGISYSPLYIHKFSLYIPYKFLTADKLKNKFKDFSNIKTTAEKIKWLRIEKGLLQTDVAKYLNIDRTSYVAYERIEREFYSIEKLQKLSKLFNIDIIYLLDEYNYFLYKGQAKIIKNIRKKLNLTQENLANLVNATKSNVNNWEQSRVIISKDKWKKINKIIKENNIHI